MEVNEILSHLKFTITSKGSFDSAHMNMVTIDVLSAIVSKFLSCRHRSSVNRNRIDLKAKCVNIHECE